MSANPKKKSNDNDGRRASRRLSDAGDTNLVSPTPQGRPAPKKLQFSQRNIKINYCTDLIGLEHKFLCDGCQRVKSSVRASVKPCEELKSKELQCFKAWTYKEEDIPTAVFEHYSAVAQFIENQHNIDAEMLVVDTTTTTTTTNDDDVVVIAPTPLPPTGRKINYWTQTISCEGEKKQYTIPTTHRIVLEADFKQWENQNNILKSVRKCLQSKKFVTKSLFSQSMWAIAMSSVPALALSAAQFAMPLFILAFFHDTGLFD